MNNEFNKLIKNQRAKSVGDLRKLEILPIHTGVSVKALVSLRCFF